jgi:predicted GNAT superfamily acetyltransferase
MAEEYVPDCYGRFPSLLERGLPSDRWVVNWKVSTARVEKRLRGEAPPFDPTVPRVNETKLTAQGFAQNRSIRPDLTGRHLLVEIPSQTDAMRTKAMPLARRWRTEARTIFQNYLARGYHVEDFFPPQPETEGRSFYLLQQRAQGLPSTRP